MLLTEELAVDVSGRSTRTVESAATVMQTSRTHVTSEQKVPKLINIHVHMYMYM